MVAGSDDGAGDELAGFGGVAARHVDLDVLLTEGCRRAAEGLGVSHAKLLEYLPEQRRLLVRAGTGWDEDVVGNAHVGADLASPAGFALQTGQPTLAGDLATEQRFRVPDLLRRHGIRSAVNVIVRFGEANFGVLEADSRTSRVFDERDVRFLQGFADVMALAIAQQEASRSHAAAARRLELALDELRHRTSNNNQLLLSIIRLSRREDDILETRQALEDLAHRIEALIGVDHAIVGAGDPGRIDLGRYVVGIVQSLLAAHDGWKAAVKLDAEVGEVLIDGRAAQSLGLIVNEFVTNSFKHAFAGAGGDELELRIEGAGRRVTLELADNGPGRPPDARPGLGTRLIEAMAHHLGTEAEWVATPLGTRLRIGFDRGEAGA